MNAILAISAALASFVPLAVVLLGLRKPPTHRRDHKITAHRRGNSPQAPAAGRLPGSVLKGAARLSSHERWR